MYQGLESQDFLDDGGSGSDTEYFRRECKLGFRGADSGYANMPRSDSTLRSCSRTSGFFSSLRRSGSRAGYCSVLSRQSTRLSTLYGVSSLSSTGSDRRKISAADGKHVECRSSAPSGGNSSRRWRSAMKTPARSEVSFPSPSVSSGSSCRFLSPWWR